MLKHVVHSAVALTCLAALFRSPAAVAGPVYQNQAKGYSLTLPDGWAPLSPEKLSEVAAAVSNSGAPGTMTVDAGYAPGGVIGPDAQFLVIAVLPDGDGKQMRTGRMDEFMRGVIQGATKSGGPNVTVESSNLDKAAKTYRLDMVVAANGMKLHARLAGFIGHRDIVQICAYGSDDVFPEADAKYQQVAKSFKFDPSFAFDDSEENSPMIAIGAIGLGVIIAALVAVVLAVRASRKRPAVVPFAGYGGYPQQSAPPPGWAGSTGSGQAYPPPPPAGQWPPR